MNHTTLGIVAILSGPAVLLAAGRSVLIMSISIILALNVAYPIFVGISTSGSVSIVSDLTIYQEAKADRSDQHGGNGNTDPASGAPLIGGTSKMPDFDDPKNGNGGNGGRAVAGGTANGGDGSSNGKGNGGNGGIAVGQGSDASGTAATGDTNGFNGGIAVIGGHTDPANGCNIAVGSMCLNRP
jgi:hypothetical protein